MKAKALPVRCYDNGGPDVKGGTIDRYTVVFTEAIREPGESRFSPGVYAYVGMNSAPFHPQGFGQHGETRGYPADSNASGSLGVPRIGKSCHLGKRIPFEELPPDCQKLVQQDLAAMAGTITAKGGK